MAERVLSSVPWLRIVFLTSAFLALPKCSMTQTQQQYVYGSVPITTATSEVLGYAKNGSTGALTAASGSPFADRLEGGALAIDGKGRFLFVLNFSTSSISMFQIDQSTGNLAEVTGSPFSTGPTENPNMAPTSPICLAGEPSGQFLYVGYRFGNFTGQGAVNEYLIDATNLQLVPLSGQPTTDIPSSPIGMFTDSKGMHLYVGLGQNASTGAQDAGTQVYSINATSGQLSMAGSAGNAASDGRSIAIDPKGRFFYDGWGATLGTIDSALISPADGTATTGISTITLAQNVIPSAMLAESSGNFLYVQESAAPQVYSINQTSGTLSPASAALGAFTFRTGSAAADPLGPYLYSLQADGIHGFLINAQTGALSEIAGSPFTPGPVAQGMLTISGTPVQAASGPVAALFPSSVSFGNVTVGQPSNSQLVTLTNTGNQGLSVNSVALAGANPGDFAATPNCTFPTVLAPNATCTVSVVFTPTATGPRQASLTATDNAPGSPQSIPLSGTGVAPQPAVTLAPGSLTFPTTAQGATSAAQSVTLTNAGSATLNIVSVLLSGTNPGDFTLTNACNGAVAVNATCSMSVTFSPLGAGQRLASIVITDDAPNSPQSVQLTGTGAAPPQTRPAVTLSTNSVSLGAVTQGTTAAPQTITLTSSGTATLHISSVTLGGSNSADISLSNGCAAGAYAVNTTCTIGVAFSPVTLGARSAVITITDDAPDSPQMINIAASVNPALTITAASSGGTSISITAGQTANFNLLVTPGAGFSGSASFTCTGAPLAATCSAPSVQLSGGTTAPETVAVSTTGSGMLVLNWKTRPVGPSAGLETSVALFVLTFIVFLLFQGRRAVPRPALLRIACFSAVVLLAGFRSAGCGGGSVSPASAQSPPTPTGVTPHGTSTLVLTPTATTASGKQLPSLAPIQLTLTVN